MHRFGFVLSLVIVGIFGTCAASQETIHSFTDAAGTSVEYFEYGYPNEQLSPGTVDTLTDTDDTWLEASGVQMASGETAGYAGACDEGCDTMGVMASCDDCQLITCGCTPWWAHRSGGFGELLYLSPASADLIYVREQTGPNPNASPTGPLGISNIDAHAGFRVGLGYAFTDCCSLVASYARWDGDTFSQTDATNPYVLDSLLIHPSTATTGAASLSATADQLVNFQVVDAMFRKVYKSTDCSVINWNAGLRYGNLEQGLIGTQTVAVATGLTTVTTDVDFSGWGVIGGLDAERRARESGFLIYGKAFGSLLAGDWYADYTQVNQFGGGVDRIGISGLRPAGGEMVGPCPICAGRDRFAINLRTHAFLCRKCDIKGGDQVALVQQVLGLSFVDALSFLCGEAPAQIDKYEMERRRRKAAAAEKKQAEAQERYRRQAMKDARIIWNNARDGNLGIVPAYLRARGFSNQMIARVPVALRFIVDHPYVKKSGRDLVTMHRGPAMIAGILSHAGHLTAVHQTWVDPKPPHGKAKIMWEGQAMPAKMVRGSKKGGAIRLITPEKP